MNELYALMVRLSMETTGFSGAAGIALRAFTQMESGAGRAEGAMATLQRRIDSTAFSAGQRFDRMAQSHQQAMDRMAFQGADPAQMGFAAGQMDARMALAMQQHQARMDLLTGQQTELAAASSAAAARMAQAQRGVGLLAAGGAAAVGGLGLTAMLADTVKHALVFQTVMLGVQQATGASADQMERLNKVAVDVGKTNQMSSTQVAELMRAEVQAGLTVAGTTATQRVAALAAVTRPVANFAEVLKMTRGLPQDESAKIAVEFAHLFGRWDPQSVTRMTDMLGRVLTITPSTPQELLHLTSQFAGTLRPLYARDAAGQALFMSDTIQTAALESILGQQTRGGTQIAAMMARTLGTGRMSAKARAAMAEIDRLGHGTFFGAQGQDLGMANALELLGRAAASPGMTPLRLGRLIQNAFGQTGARQVGLLTEPSTFAAFRNLGTQLGPGGVPSMQAIRDAYNRTPAGQFAQAQANMETFATLVGTQLLPAATKLADVLATITNRVVSFAEEHPQLVKFAATFAAVAAGAALVVAPILATAGAMAILAAAGVGVTLSLAPILITVVAIAVAVAGLTLVFMHWNETMDLLSGKTSLFAKFGVVGAIFDSILAPVHLVIQAIQMAITVWEKLHGLVDPGRHPQVALGPPGAPVTLLPPPLPRVTGTPTPSVSGSAPQSPAHTAAALHATLSTSSHTAAGPPPLPTSPHPAVAAVSQRAPVMVIERVSVPPLALPQVHLPPMAIPRGTATPTPLPGRPAPATPARASSAAPILNLHHTIIVNPHPQQNVHHLVALIARHLDDREREAKDRFHDLISFGQSGHAGLSVNLASP